MRELIGRGSELAAVRLVLDRARSSESGFVLLLGEAGIGKTRLLGAIAEEAIALGLRPLSGTAIESGTGLPFLPLMAPLHQATSDPRIGDRAIGIVRGLLRGDSTADPTANPSDAGGAARLIEAIHDVLVRQPTALLLDDVQWADTSTLTVLDYLAHRSRDVPLAVIVAARDDEPGVLRPSPITDGRRFGALQVRRLSESEVAAQITSLVGAVPDRATVRRIFERAAGNPFFVEQIVAASDDELPTNLRLLVGRRIDRLTRGTRAVVDALAIIGRGASQELIAAVAQQDLATTLAALDEALSVGIVVQDHAGTDLRHPIFREVILDGIDRSRSGVLHRKAAQALEAAGDSVTEVAGHWWLGDDPRRAWASALEAGAAAEATMAYAEVRLHLERALRRWPADAPGRGPVTLRAAHAAWVSGDAEAAVRLVRDGPFDDPSSVERLTAQGSYEWDTGDRASSAESFQRVADQLTESTPPRLRARAYWGLGRAHVGEGRFDEAADFATRSATIATEAGLPVAAAEALMLFGMARAWAGSLDGIEALERAVVLAEAGGEPSTIGQAHQFLVDLLMLNGDLPRALQIAQQGIGISDRLGVARVHGSDLRGRAGLVLLELGRWDEASDILEPADPRAFPSLARALLATRRGSFDEARIALDAAAVGGAIGGPGALGGWLELARTELAWTTGDSAAALQALTPAPFAPGAWALDIDARTAWWLARIAPDPAQARERATTAARNPDRLLARALVGDIEAETARDAAAAWSASAGAWAMANRPYERGNARLREAQARFTLGDRKAAREALLDAAEVAAGLRAAPLARLAEDLARRARVAVRPVRRHDPDPQELTQRELEVLRLVADGLTNPQIGERLFLSRKTVGIHVSRILDKLGAHTRGAAAAIARRDGLLD